MHPSVPEFMTLFEGYSKAHGIYRVKETVTETGKKIGDAATVFRDVTVELWSAHLCGDVGLGIIPINGDSNVKFGAIDIDIYPLDLTALAKRIHEFKLPLVVTRTKSGGAHLWLFLSQFTPAKLVQDRLREFASFLGYGTSEVYPKQTKILVERGDLGQWINMPYFNAAKSTRHGFNEFGRQLSVEEFVKFAFSRITTADALNKIALPTTSDLEEGPPCLRHLIVQGFPAGTRNNGLFNLAVYARKRDPDKWQEMVEAYNHKYMDPPLSPKEVLGVIKSLGKKDYVYTCKVPPISTYCDATKCKRCKFGIGGGVGLPKLGTLTKLATKPPVWFIDVEGGGRLELSSEDLQSSLRFQLRCMETLNVMPAVMKRDEWNDVVQKLLTDVNIIEVASDATPRGQLFSHLEDFCTSRAQATTNEEMLLGKPWLCKGRHYFRLKDFLKYLDRQRFEVELNQLMLSLRDLNYTKQFFNIKGKGVNCISVPEFVTKQEEEFTTPEFGDQNAI